MAKRYLEDDEPCIRRHKRNRIQVLSDDEEPEYKIEKIRACKFKDNKWFFLIKWLGYPESDNSWEPKENLNEEALKSISDIPIDIDSDADTDTEDINSARYLFLQQQMQGDINSPDSYRKKLLSKCLNENNGFIKHSEQLGTEIGLNSLNENASNKFELPRTGITRKYDVNKGKCDVCNRNRTLKYSAFLKFKTSKGEHVEKECIIGSVCALRIRFLYLFRRVLTYLDNNKKTLEEITLIFNILRENASQVIQKIKSYNPKRPFGKFNGRIHFPMDDNIPCSY